MVWKFKFKQNKTYIDTMYMFPLVQLRFTMKYKTIYSIDFSILRNMITKSDIKMVVKHFWFCKINKKKIQFK